MSLGIYLRNFITSSTAIASNFSDVTAEGVVQQDTMPKDAPSPRIWYSRATQKVHRDVSGAALYTESRWDIECLSDDIDESLAIAGDVKTRLDGFYGAMGSTSSNTPVKAIYVEDYDNDYIPQGVGEEDGTHVAAISATIFS
jgi:hypothetical protein